ncbi:LiaI-LiaF-like domain-containing protein [Chitinilyticum piscinae]|uniref:LiaI-LiaF-like transmembrane region domain-containing protein n=1 Tax=Chitinilyticum piscinae TaxID=2866724 RepID=A0A8J7K134_9NEIS|nr:DUF5668 domain-containing protein [Chitinilyticum piscinae]MBE9608636.1 hypothetical protein [Chitinilyticum piscinae]
MQRFPLHSLILIALGVFFLGAELDWWTTALLARGWPLILIAVGIASLWRRGHCRHSHKEE